MTLATVIVAVVVIGLAGGLGVVLARRGSQHGAEERGLTPEQRARLAVLRDAWDGVNRDLNAASTAAYYAQQTYRRSRESGDLRDYRAALERCVAAVEAVMAAERALSEERRRLTAREGP